jgi:hypothetical protein
MTMFTRYVIAGAAAIASAAMTGCATVDYSSAGMLKNATIKGAKGANEGQTVVISTIGYYMFWTIPLATGDLRWDPEKKSIKGGTTLFRDQVGINELQDALLNIAESRDCDLADVYFSDSDASFAEVSQGGAIGTFFGSSQMGVSAILVPRAAKSK